MLVIEVADGSLARDRRKTGLYAAAGIPECWIIDLTAALDAPETPELLAHVRGAGFVA